MVAPCWALHVGACRIPLNSSLVGTARAPAAASRANIANAHRPWEPLSRVASSIPLSTSAVGARHGAGGTLRLSGLSEIAQAVIAPPHALPFRAALNRKRCARKLRAEFCTRNFSRE
eukprot:5506459-Pleurochrysis_carterae.AAC.2